MKKIFILLLVFLAIPAVTQASFLDVATSHSNSTAIDFVQSEGIVGGYDDGTFRPDDTINRAELIKIIVETNFTKAEIDGCILENNSFLDVKNNDWFVKYVCITKNRNIVSGYPDGTFQPANPVNFAEAAKIISGAFGFSIGENEIWFKPFVDQLGSRGAIPITITSFDKNITRGEMAEMIWRLKTGNEEEESVDFAGIEGNLFEELNYISSAECQTKNGEIINVDPKNPECPDGKEFFGMVGNVNCICACCGNIEFERTANMSSALYSMYLNYKKNGISQVSELNLHDLPCWLTAFKELSDKEVAELDKLNIVINDYYLLKDHFYNINLSISIIPNLAEFSFVKNLKGAWGVPMPESSHENIILDG